MHVNPFMNYMFHILLPLLNFAQLDKFLMTLLWIIQAVLYSYW